MLNNKIMNKFAEQETLLLKKMAELQEQLAKLNADKVARIKELKDLIPSLIYELYELEGNSYTWSTPANQDALESIVVEETAPVIEEEESQEEMIATTDVVDATEETLDEEHSDESEERYNVIGCVERILFVVYTERGENNIRIISARRATPKEEKLYYEDYDIR